MGSDDDYDENYAYDEDIVSDDDDDNEDGALDDEGIFKPSSALVEGFNPSSSGGAQTTSKSKTKKKTGFQALGLSKHVFGGIMRMGYKIPTPIQRATLPISLSG